MARQSLTLAQNQRLINGIVEQLKSMPDHTFHGTITDLVNKIREKKGTKVPFKNTTTMKSRVKQLADKKVLTVSRPNDAQYGRVTSIVLVDETRAVLTPRGSSRASSHVDSTSERNPQSTTSCRRGIVLRTVAMLFSAKAAKGEDMVIPKIVDIGEQLKLTDESIPDRTLRDDLYFLKEIGLINIKPYTDQNRTARKVTLGENQSVDSLLHILSEETPLDNAALKEKDTQKPACKPDKVDDETKTDPEVPEAKDPQPEQQPQRNASSIDMNDMIADMQTSLQQLENKRTQMQQTLKTVGQTKEELTNQATELTKQRDLEQQKLDVLNKVPSAIKTDKYHETCKRLKTHIDELRRKHADIVAQVSTIDTSQAQNPQELQDEIAQLDEDISETKAAITQLQAMM